MFEQEAMLPTLFYPTEANQVTQGGQIIRVMGSIGSAAKNSVVTIDRGRLDGVQSGHVFAIYQQGETVQDPKTKERIKLPNQKVGTLMVFRTFDQLSYAYVLESSYRLKWVLRFCLPVLTIKNPSYAKQFESSSLPHHCGVVSGTTFSFCISKNQTSFW
jgi:hypothetical protein